MNCVRYVLKSIAKLEKRKYYEGAGMSIEDFLLADQTYLSNLVRVTTAFAFYHAIVFTKINFSVKR